jgi:ABC-type sugar transport system permease subunit
VTTINSTTVTTQPRPLGTRDRDAAERATSPRGPNWWKFRTRSAPYLFLLPWFLVTATFFLYPLIYATVLAFYQTNGPAYRAFVGLDNFRFILRDPDFHTALWNTSVFAFFSIFLQLPLSLGLALLLNARQGRMKGLFRLMIFAPNLVGQVFVAILFAMMFTPRYGLFNRLLHALIGWGLENRWTQDPTLVMPGLIIAALWMYVGFNMIFFLAALQNVDQSLVEAAKIDGAGPVQQFLNVTLPAIAPVATFVVVTSTIGSFQLFELPYILLQGFGPRNAGLTIVGYLYNYAFDSGDLGTGAAVGWILTLIILGIALVQIRLSRNVGSER